MIEILLAIGVATFIVHTTFYIYSLVTIKRTGERMLNLLTTMEGNMSAVLNELKAALENVKGITDDARAVTNDVRLISASVVSLQKDMRSTVEANIAGLQAGIKTAVVSLVKQLQEGRSDDHDGKT